MLDINRSLLMSKVDSKNSTPELIVRKLIYSLGYRYRLHRKDIPGTPDIVFSKRKKVIFVHGCFWHRHENCSKSTTPKSNVEFWINKFSTNIQRDKSNYKKLDAMGWKYLVIWECETKKSGIDVLTQKIVEFLQ
ncbi:MAG: very short patch repair endonuclease [Candidatus Auribacterota bacterium]